MEDQELPRLTMLSSPRSHEAREGNDKSEEGMGRPPFLLLVDASSFCQQLGLAVHPIKGWKASLPLNNRNELTDLMSASPSHQTAMIS